MAVQGNLVRNSPRLIMRDGGAAKRWFLSSAEIYALRLEKNVSEQCATGNGALIVAFAEGRTGRFKNEELGLGFEEYPSILTVQATLREDNRTRRDSLHRQAKQIIDAFLADAKKRGVRGDMKPLEHATGCTGCASCVAETRAKPRRSKDPAHRRDVEPTWIPRRVGRGRAPTVATGDERVRRDSDGRKRMKDRRAAEEEIVRSLVRRAGAVVEEPPPGKN